MVCIFPDKKYKCNEIIESKFTRQADLHPESIKSPIKQGNINTMAEAKIYLRDLKVGYYVVKKFVIKGDAVYQNEAANNEDGDITVEIGDDSYLILNDQYIAAVNKFIEDHKGEDFSSIDKGILAMQKQFNSNDSELFIWFLEPYIEYGYCELGFNMKMQKLFDKFMAESKVENKND